MNERYKLNKELIRAWLDAEGRKRSYVAGKLCISGDLMNKMLSGGHVPKERTLNALAALMGVAAGKLLIPKVAKAG